MGREEKKKRCVECGLIVKSLFIQYSAVSFRLIKCENCEQVADEYIECELMIIFIDLVLHKAKAYRHLLYNVFNQETVNVRFRGFHNLAASAVETCLGFSSSRYLSLLLRRTYNDESSVSSESFLLASLKVFVNVLSANLAFVLSSALAAKICSIGKSRRKEIILGILISNYVKIFLFALPVWELPVSVIFIVDMLVLTSNTVALKVITESTTTKCLTACVVAHLIRFLADQVSGSRSLTHLLGSVMSLPCLFKKLVI